MVFALRKRELQIDQTESFVMSWTSHHHPSQVSFVVSDLEQNRCSLSASNPFLFACQCLSAGIKHLPNVGLENVKQAQAVN